MVLQNSNFINPLYFYEFSIIKQQTCNIRSNVFDISLRKPNDCRNLTYSSQNRVSCGNFDKACAYNCFMRLTIDFAILLLVFIFCDFIRSFVKLIMPRSYFMYSRKSFISRDGCVIRYSKFSRAFFIFLQNVKSKLIKSAINKFLILKKLIRFVFT